MGHQLLVRIRLTIGGFILALALAAGLFMGHHLSPVGFAISVLVLAVIAGIVLTRFLQQFRNVDPLQPLDERTLRRQQRTLKSMLAILFFCLLLGLWETRSDPILPRVTGIAISLFFITTSILNLRRGRAKLKQLQDRRTL